MVKGISVSDVIPCINKYKNMEPEEGSIFDERKIV